MGMRSPNRAVPPLSSSVHGQSHLMHVPEESKFDDQFHMPALFTASRGGARANGTPSTSSSHPVQQPRPRGRYTRLGPSAGRGGLRHANSPENDDWDSLNDAINASLDRYRSGDGGSAEQDPMGNDGWQQERDSSPDDQRHLNHMLWETQSVSSVRTMDSVYYPGPGGEWLDPSQIVSEDCIREARRDGSWRKGEFGKCWFVNYDAKTYVFQPDRKTIVDVDGGDEDGSQGDAMEIASCTTTASAHNPNYDADPQPAHGANVPPSKPASPAASAPAAGTSSAPPDKT